MAAGKNSCVQGDLFIEVLGWELVGAREIFGEGKKAPARTAVREDGNKSAFAVVFDDRMDGAGGGGRRYCGESVGAVMCIFGGNGRVEGGGIMKERG